MLLISHILLNIVTNIGWIVLRFWDLKIIFDFIVSPEKFVARVFRGPEKNVFKENNNNNNKIL